MYNLLQLIHILGIIVWFGGSVMLIVLGGAAARKDNLTVAGVASVIATTGRVFGPAAGVALLAGIGMLLTANSPYDFSAPWVSIGFVVWFVCIFLGSRVIGPGWDSLATLAAAGDDGAVQAQRARLTGPMMVNATLLLIAVAAMVFKWGT